jgi:Peptidase C13 family
MNYIRLKRIIYVAILVISIPLRAQNILSVDTDADRARIERLQAQSAALKPAAILANQNTLLKRFIAKVDSGVKGKTDIFVLGFAGDGTQDVFLSEVEYAAEKIAERYQTNKRTLLLVNNLRSLKKYPLATFDNLKKVLKGLSGKMNGSEDVLLLFATSHGSPNRTISVQLPGFKMLDLSAEQLRAALDEAEIRNRIIIISACFSGGFIPALENESSAIFTAAAYNRTSFGCANDRKLTYFGDAFFQKNLIAAPSLESAFENSLALIAEWERRDSLVHSQPVSSIGANIRTILDKIEADRIGKK